MSRHALATGLTIAVALLGACATAVPTVLAPASGTQPALRLAARGVQIYECRARADGVEWAFVAPRAELLDAAGRVVGSHGAGPFWQAADGSRIVGRVAARADAPRADAIAWLLLDARSEGSDGRFAKVAQVQRLNTEGGLAPAAGCDRTRVGQRAEVPYRADYVFFNPTL